MKFKNSYILLIAMAIFLLVSVGSVCASENITTDSDAQLASADTDVVFADENGDTSLNDGETTQEKINTTVTAKDAKFGYDEDKNISVTVKDNNSQEIKNVTESNLTVFEGNSSLNFKYNNSILTITDKLPVGEHNIILNYLGNANYTNSTTSILLKVFGNKTLEAGNVVINGTTIEIPVKVSDGVDELNITKEEFGKLTLTYTNSTGNKSEIEITEFNVENGKILASFNYIDFVTATLTINYTNATTPLTRNVTVKYGTKINAEGNKFRDTENKTISIDVTDYFEHTLNITQANLKITENGKDVAFTYNNSVIKFTSLTRGNHTLTIKFIGNDTFNETSKEIIVGVYGNYTISPSEIAKIDSNNQTSIVLNLSDGIDLQDIEKDNLTITLYFTKGNEASNITLKASDITIDGQTITFTVAKSFDTARADIKYVAQTNLTGTTILKVDTELNASDLEKGESEVKNFTIEVKASNGNVINLTKSDLQVLNNGKAANFNINNSVITITDKLTPGIYNLTIKFLGTDTFAESSKNITLTVYGFNATSSIDVNSTKKGELNLTIINGNETVDITIEDLTLNVTYKNGNDTVVINITSKTIENGTLYFTLENGNFTTATLNIKYRETETNVTLNRIYNAKIEAITIENEYRNGNFTFRLVDVDDNSNLAGKSVSLYTTGNIRAGFSATTDSNGIASYKNINLYVFDQSSSSLNMKQLEVGSYPVEISTSGSIKTTTLKTNLTVTPANINIVVNPYRESYGSEQNITINVTNAKNGEAVSGIILKLSMPQTSGQTYYITTDSNGIGRIATKGLVGGDYDLTVSNNDTVNIVNTSTKATITIVKIPTTINAKDVTVYFNTGTTATIKVTDKATGNPVAGMYILVELDKDSKKTYLFQTDDKGQISFSASLNVGTHKMTISSADSRYDASSVTKTITVKKASAKITAKKVTAYYKGGKYFTVKLTNTKNNKPIYDAKVNIKIFVSENRYYNYNGNTGSNGELKLLLDSLKPGTYKVVISGADGKDYSASEVTSKIVIKKAPTKFVAKKLTAKKGKSKNFKITVKNKKTKKVVSGVKVKVKVYTGKKSKTYTLKSNSKGIAKFNVKKLKVGKHKVTVKSANKYCVAKTAKSTITIKK